MAKPFDFGEINLTAGAEDSPATLKSDTPFCVAILGDFSGRKSRGVCDPGSIASRSRILIDRDNFEEVFAKLSPEIRLRIDGAGASVNLRFSEFEEFHPDRLFQRDPLFHRLRSIRSRLQDPASFAVIAQELGWVSGQPIRPKDAASEPKPSLASSTRSIAGGNLLDQTIEQTEKRAPEEEPRRPDELQAFVRRVTESHLVAAPDPRRTELTDAIDRAISAQMRAVLRTPDFQELEAAWRAMFLTVRRVETSSQLKLYLVDVSKEELAADLGSTSDLLSTGIYRLLVEKSVGTPGAEPWTLIAGVYTFGNDRHDLELLGRLGKIGATAGAPFLAAASPRLLGCISLAATPDPRNWTEDSNGAWAALRQLPESGAIGLAIPQFLLRLPYGKKTDPIESFDFEEMPDTPVHENYLWGNPAFVCVILLAQSFSEYGWALRPGIVSELDGLPLHIYERNGESELQPCAEALLTERASESILEEGLMPLLSIKGRDAVRLARFQSIAEPLRPLTGRWEG